MSNQPSESLPPGIARGDRVILFDGVCRLCSFWARFIIRFDTGHRFKLATVQSAEGEAILKWFDMPTDDYQTLLLVENHTLYIKSSAILRVVRQLPFPWPAACVGWLLPRFLRDWLYDRIARNRYRLFGKYDVCVRLTADHKGRFLDAK